MSKCGRIRPFFSHPANCKLATGAAKKHSFSHPAMLSCWWGHMHTTCFATAKIILYQVLFPSSLSRKKTWVQHLLNAPIAHVLRSRRTTCGRDAVLCAGRVQVVLTSSNRLMARAYSQPTACWAVSFLSRSFCARWARSFDMF